MGRMKVDSVRFGKFIAKRRAAIKSVKTQVLLAKRVGVSKGTIGKIETGERLPSFELFIDIADALLLTPGELMMVLAERETINKNHMELNDWLYDKLIKIVREYEALITPPPQQHPQLTSGQAKENRMLEDFAVHDPIADATPDVVPPVDPELGSNQEPVNPNPTNSGK